MKKVVREKWELRLVLAELNAVLWTLLRLPSGHSGSVLILSNAARASLPSPHLLVAGTGVCAAPLLRELLLGT